MSDNKEYENDVNYKEVTSDDDFKEVESDDAVDIDVEKDDETTNKDKVNLDKVEQERWFIYQIIYVYVLIVCKKHLIL